MYTRDFKFYQYFKNFTETRKTLLDFVQKLGREMIDDSFVFCDVITDPDDAHHVVGYQCMTVVKKLPDEREGDEKIIDEGFIEARVIPFKSVTMVLVAVPRVPLITPR